MSLKARGQELIVANILSLISLAIPLFLLNTRVVLSNITTEEELSSHFEAAKNDRWVTAMKTEIKALKTMRHGRLCHFQKERKL